MEKIVLNYEHNDTFAKKMIEALLASGAFSLERKTRKTELQKSIEEAHNGKYFVAGDAKDAILKCLS
jgi:capsule polysaccharide modification protein KpsS